MKRPVLGECGGPAWVIPKGVKVHPGIFSNIWARIPRTAIMKLHRDQDQAAPWWKRIWP